jgi:hypothetical protein
MKGSRFLQSMHLRFVRTNLRMTFIPQSRCGSFPPRNILRRVARRISRTRFSTSSESVAAFVLVARSFAVQDELKIPSSSIIHFIQLVLTVNRPTSLLKSILAPIGQMLGSTAAMAQTSNLLIPYGMGAGMQVLNRALQPRPEAAPTPEINAGGYGAQPGERRLVCEQWNGQQWVVIPVAAGQCQP